MWLTCSHPDFMSHPSSACSHVKNFVCGFDLQVLDSQLGQWPVHKVVHFVITLCNTVVVSCMQSHNNTCTLHNANAASRCTVYVVFSSSIYVPLLSSMLL